MKILLPLDGDTLARNKGTKLKGSIYNTNVYMYSIYSFPPFSSHSPPSLSLPSFPPSLLCGILPDSSSPFRLFGYHLRFLSPSFPIFLSPSFPIFLSHFLPPTLPPPFCLQMNETDPSTSTPQDPWGCRLS